MKISNHIYLFGRVRFLDKVLFTKHLAIMLKSGITLAEATRALSEQTQNPYFRKILQQVATQVSNGKSLHKSLAAYPHEFDGLYRSLIKIGEESGSLGKNLEFLAEKLKKDYSFKKKVQSASLYPLIILTATGVIGLGISYFVLPKLTDLFESLDVTLPLSTRILLFIANTMKQYGIFIVAGVVALVVMFNTLIRAPSIKPLWQRFLLHLPYIGAFIQNIESASLCRNLGVMLKSGLSLTNSLATQNEATDNAVFKAYADRLKKGLDKGQSIAAQLESGRFPFIPSIVAKMIEVGEKTGKLGETCTYLGDFFESEVDNATKNLSTVLEPILLILISLVVAFVAMAIITPIYEFTGSVK